MHESNQLVHESIKLAKTLADSLTMQFAFASCPKSKKSRKHKVKVVIPKTPAQHKQEQEDDLGDHANANDKDPPKPNYYKPQTPTKQTPDEHFDDCGDDITPLNI